MDEQKDQTEDPVALLSLRGATIVLGVTGGIAAYKVVEVCRQLVDAGATVLPVLTESAERFVGTATFSALASEPVRTEVFDDVIDPIPHTALARRADLILVAPATARFLGAYTAGISDDLLGATLLASRAPVLVCPAMHTEMWEHPSVQHNIDVLVSRGVRIAGPAKGHLAGGDEGDGRLLEPEEIVQAAAAVLSRPRDLAGVRILVTAGGTREPIDAVRFLANRSSGRQGHAIAQAARDRGASVTLVTASQLEPPPLVQTVAIETADELATQVLEHLEETDVVIMAAAVADYTVAHPLSSKWKKRDGVLRIELTETTDILSAVVKARREDQIIVGFAAETDDVVANATSKLVEKGADLIVLNDVSAPGVGFAHETNAVTILGESTGPVVVSLGSKLVIADAVLDAVLRMRHARAHGDHAL